MRACLAALAVVSVVGLATPALADFGSAGSIQHAIDAAYASGVVGISEIQFFDGKWEIQGRDMRGQSINMDVDALTGAVLKINRY